MVGARVSHQYSVCGVWILEVLEVLEEVSSEGRVGMGHEITAAGAGQDSSSS